jgi:hypothetical protein
MGMTSNDQGPARALWPPLTAWAGGGRGVARAGGGDALCQGLGRGGPRRVRHHARHTPRAGPAARTDTQTQMHTLTAQAPTLTPHTLRQHTDTHTQHTLSYTHPRTTHTLIHTLTHNTHAHTTHTLTQHARTHAAQPPFPTPSPRLPPHAGGRAPLVPLVRVVPSHGPSRAESRSESCRVTAAAAEQGRGSAPPPVRPHSSAR